MYICPKPPYLLEVNMPSLGFGKQCNISPKKERLMAYC